MGLIRSLSLLFLVSLFNCNVESQRVKEKMYESIDGAYACFRRLNGTHQFGCTSSRSGNVGVVHIIESKSDADWLINNGLAAPYVAVLRPSLFTKSLLLELQSSGKVNGVALIYNGTLDKPNSFSHEDTCPNRYSGLSSPFKQTCGIGEREPWNPMGSSVLLMDWKFPIFYFTEQSQIENLYKCYHTHNEVSEPSEQLHRSLCALELRSHMYGAVSSQKCIKRNSYMTIFSQTNSCDPLGGRNVWQTLFPRSNHKADNMIDQKPVKSEANGSIAVLATRMDATSMFDGLVPSSIGAVTGIVTLLSTAELLHRMLPQNDKYDKNILFLLLHGESYDYIGSSRIVYDMKQNIFPVRPDPSVTQPPPIGLHHIGPFIELSQLTKPANGQPLFIHRLNDTNEVLSNFIKVLKRNGNFSNIAISDELPASDNLPPASLQSFLKEKPDIPGLVLTGHGKQFSNRYYHSVLDDSVSLDYTYANGSAVPKDSIQAYLTDVSTTLAHSLAEHVTGVPYPGAAVANSSLVDELLYCYLEQSNCSLFQSATGGNSVGVGKPLSYYVGVYHVPALVPLLTGAALALLTGTPTSHNETECHNNASTDQVYQYIWVVSPHWQDPTSAKVCLQTTMNFTAAVSPAFVIEGYNMSSGNYSTWTESVWPELTAKMFLKPSSNQEVMTLSLGIIVLILSFACVTFIKVRKEVLFSPGLPST